MDDKNMSLEDLIKRDRKLKRGGNRGGNRGGHRGNFGGRGGSINQGRRQGGLN